MKKNETHINLKKTFQQNGKWNCKKKTTIVYSEIHNATGFELKEAVLLSQEGRLAGFLKIEGAKIQTTQQWNENFIQEDLLPEIVTYLNEVLGTKYSPTTGDTKKHIRARLKEGYSLQDFKMVIDSRNSDWSEDAHMRQYLRPATLFGTKFESYLQYAITNTIKPIIPKENGTGKQKPTNFESVAGAYSDIPD